MKTDEAGLMQVWAEAFRGHRETVERQSEAAEGPWWVHHRCMVVRAWTDRGLEADQRVQR